MCPSAPSRRIRRFADFEVELEHGLLTRQGVRVKLQDQPFRILAMLLELPGEIVTREELRQKLWPNGTHVDFDGSLNAALKRLRAALGDDREKPSFIETVPKRGYRFVAPVSVEAPQGDVFDGKGGDPAFPTGVMMPADQALPQRLRVRWHKATLASCILLMVVFLGVSVSYRHSHDSAGNTTLSAAMKPVATRRAIAVIGFHNLSGKKEDAWLATALTEMLSTELAGGERLRLVSGEDVANLQMNSPWSQTDTLNRETAARIGSALDSDYLVFGSYATTESVDGERLRLDVRLQDAKQGEILAEIAEVSGRRDLFRLVSRVGARLRDRLGVPRLTETDQAGVLASVPLDPEGARFYASGIEKLRQFDALAAKDLLLQATRVDPKFSLAHAMLARAWSQLGYEQKRREEAAKAVDLSTDLPQAERLLVEGDYYESLGKHEKAASVYSALFQLYPDNVDYGLQLASTDLLAAHAGQARDVLARLQLLPPAASSDPRIDLVEARALAPQDRPAALQLIRSAVSKALAQGKKLLAAQARRDECMNLVYGEHPEQGLPACEDAYNIFISAGNRLGAADCLRLTGDLEGSRGHYEQAIATYQRALSVLEKLGEHEKTGAILNNMAIDFVNEGKLDRGEQLYREAKHHFAQAGDKLNEITAFANIADVQYLRGDLVGAAKLYQQGIEIAASFDPSDPAYLFYRLADLQLTQGHPEDARKGAEEAIDSLRRSHGGYEYLASAITVLGKVKEAEGDLEGARHGYDEAVAIALRSAEMDLVEETRTQMAELSLEQGQPEQAEALLRPAIAQFEKEKGDPDASSAYTLLSRALQMEGRLDEANAAVKRASKLANTSADPALKLPVAIQHARLIMAKTQQGTAASIAARRELRSAAATAKKLGYYRIECVARQELGELEMKSTPALARTHLNALAAEARSRGLELFARRAERAAGGANPTLAANTSPK